MSVALAIFFGALLLLLVIGGGWYCFADALGADADANRSLDDLREANTRDCRRASESHPESVSGD